MRFFFCLLLADFVTGLVHWWEDAYATNDWPRNIGRENVEHHLQPELIGTPGNGDFLTRNRFALAVAGGVSVLLAVIFPFWPGFSPYAEILAVTWLAAMGNEVHAWNHRKERDNPEWVRLLQDMCVVQTRSQHNRHHRRPFNRAYCTLTNFVNPILDRLGFWEGLELIVWNFGGPWPNRGKQNRSGV